jgi:hypothetical protein
MACEELIARFAGFHVFQRIGEAALPETNLSIPATMVQGIERSG